jgi:hypothetical protein
VAGTNSKTSSYAWESSRKTGNRTILKPKAKSNASNKQSKNGYGTNPQQTYTARAKATPATTSDGHWRIRHDRVDNAGIISIRYNSRLHHIGIGRGHKNTRVKVLIHDRHIQVITAESGTLLRELTLDPTRDYQPQKPVIADTHTGYEPSPETPMNDDPRHHALVRWELVARSPPPDPSRSRKRCQVRAEPEFFAWRTGQRSGIFTQLIGARFK